MNFKTNEKVFLCFLPLMRKIIFGDKTYIESKSLWRRKKLGKQKKGTEH